MCASHRVQCAQSGPHINNPAENIFACQDMSVLYIASS